MMTWDAMIAFSQLVAAVGIILSLIFLAIQLRQNTKAVRSASIQNLVESLADTAQAAIENEYVVPILLKANAAYESLTPDSTFGLS